MGKEALWEANQRKGQKFLVIKRPCPCGCDFRDPTNKGVGYIMTSDGSGRGCTVWIEDEEAYRLLARVITEVESVDDVLPLPSLS